MSKGNTFINDVLALIFNGTTIANIAINATSSPLTVLYVSLHTSSPDAGGDQTTNEAAYGNYSRVSVARTTSGWPAPTAQYVGPAAAITFPTASSGSETETYFGIGTAATGAGKLLFFGTITPNLIIGGAGAIPQLSSTTTITET